MTSFVCVDGLAGPENITFGALKQALNIAGYRVVYASTDCIRSHEDRIDGTLKAFYGEQDYLKQNYPKEKNKIYLMGQSAGGGAVREAVVYQLGDEPVFAGVILLSPSMPFGFNYMTWPLFVVMICNLFWLMFGRTICLSANAYEYLMKPVGSGRMQAIVASRKSISVCEARKIAFFPPKFKPLGCPALYIYGDQDRWVNPKAHRKLCERFKKISKSFECHEISGAGHLTLASDSREEVIGLIKKWVKKLS